MPPQDDDEDRGVFEAMLSNIPPLTEEQKEEIRKWFERDDKFYEQLEEK